MIAWSECGSRAGRGGVERAGVAAQRSQRRQPRRRPLQSALLPSICAGLSREAAARDASHRSVAPKRHCEASLRSVTDACESEEALKVPLRAQRRSCWRMRSWEPSSLRPSRSSRTRCTPLPTPNTAPASPASEEPSVSRSCFATVELTTVAQQPLQRPLPNHRPHLSCARSLASGVDF